MIVRRRTDITYEIAAELLMLDASGTLIWRERGLTWFTDERSNCIWNKRWAGKPALASRSRRRGKPSGTLLGVGVMNSSARHLLATGRWL